MSNPHNKRLTVAIPTYNREEFLRVTLRSIAAQTMQDFSLILFDNASSYDIAALVAEFPSLDVTLLKNPSNFGNQANFVRAMSYSYDTRYVMLFHDDDTIHPRYFEDALNVLDGNEDIRWVGSLIKYTRTGRDMLKFASYPTSIPVLFCNRPELADLFMRNAPIGFSPVIYRATVFSSTRPDNVRFYKWLDRPFMLDACGDGQAAILNFPYVNYRIHPSQDSAQKYDEHIPEMINCIDYLSSAGTLPQSRIYATTASIRTAIQNADSIKEFFTILHQFRKRNLYSIRNIRPRALYWLLRLLTRRIQSFLLKR
jgi:glycosyltransferase involved in cell wall biosynthesis